MQWSLSIPYAMVIIYFLLYLIYFLSMHCICLFSRSMMHEYSMFFVMFLLIDIMISELEVSIFRGSRDIERSISKLTKL